jgi:hypothetical protein
MVVFAAGCAKEKVVPEFECQHCCVQVLLGCPEHTILWLQVFALQPPLTNTSNKKVKGVMKDRVPAVV